MAIDFQHVLGLKPSNSTSTALVASQIASTAACRLFTINVYNNKGSAQFIQIHDSATLPADTAVPVYTFSIATLATLNLTWGVYGRHMTNGLTVCNSSTAATKTIGSADCFFDIQYR